ncbi:GNAT family N-acetyltransferase [Oceanicoccus sagamiensis]|uniref:N-acetyltransferase domain-containing protein n=1 Tax=Oceanicoccus sagamiensis TaxID=716816 RepID=A0A1X9NIY0_9GAMM|nr:GNAT family N-acetyltransferase [Oceanicoccus sagamiensis]ARN75795.1 hypothetical protein BST96_17785 [Oceanicoccus sagamiensis]
MTFTVRAAIWQQDKVLLRAVRTAVFVEEQQVPIELEWDEHDEQALHWLALNEQNEAIGTCRMLADGHIGRMATLKPYRGQGVGRALLEQAIASARSDQLFEAYLYAQTHAIAFYQQAGFIAVGEEFMDANMPHKTMRLALAEQRLVGIHGGNFVIDNFKQAALDISRQAQKQCRILSYDLDARTFDNNEFRQIFSDLARKSRYTEIRILVVDTAPMVRLSHRLLTLQRRLSSNILIRKTTASPHDIKHNLIITDQCAMICQSMKDPDKIWGNYHNHPVVQSYIEQYDDLWERAKEDKDLRQLEI